MFPCIPSSYWAPISAAIETIVGRIVLAGVSHTNGALNSSSSICASICARIAQRQKPAGGMLSSVSARNPQIANFFARDRQTCNTCPLGPDRVDASSWPYVFRSATTGWIWLARRAGMHAADAVTTSSTNCDSGCVRGAGRDAKELGANEATAGECGNPAPRRWPRAPTPHAPPSQALTLAARQSRHEQANRFS